VARSPYSTHANGSLASSYRHSSAAQQARSRRYGERGPDVLREFAAVLELQAPLLPWHTDRSPIAQLATALDAAASVAAKIGLDVVLLAQTEVAEVSEHGGGRSSTMPQKQNPVRAVLARACARGVHAQASLR